MTLYEIDAAMSQLIDPDTGELKDYEAFAALNLEREAKIENTACWYKDMVADAEKIKKEIDNLVSRKRTLEARAERLKEYLSKTLGGEKFSSPRCNISYRKSISVNISDAFTVATWLEENGYERFTKYSDPTISKDGVKKLMAEGAQIPCVELTEKTSTIIK